MTRLKGLLAAVACTAVLSITAAQAGPVSYSGYSVLNNQNVSVDAPALGVFNETGGSGQITLLQTNTPGGSIASWCVDIIDMLQGSGVFTSATFLDGGLGDRINALMTHVIPTLGSDYNASSALQVAIWRTEYGPALTVSTSSAVTSLADEYLEKVGAGLWMADPAVRVAVLLGAGGNQDQAYLTPVPEPASIALLGAGLVGVGLLRRKRNPSHAHLPCARAPAGAAATLGGRHGLA